MPRPEIVDMSLAFARCLSCPNHRIASFPLHLPIFLTYLPSPFSNTYTQKSKSIQTYTRLLDRHMPLVSLPTPVLSSRPSSFRHFVPRIRLLSSQAAREGASYSRSPRPGRSRTPSTSSYSVPFGSIMYSPQFNARCALHCSTSPRCETWLTMNVLRLSSSQRSVFQAVKFEFEVRATRRYIRVTSRAYIQSA